MDKIAIRGAIGTSVMQSVSSGKGTEGKIIVTGSLLLKRNPWKAINRPIIESGWCAGRTSIPIPQRNTKRFTYFPTPRAYAFFWKLLRNEFSDQRKTLDYVADLEHSAV